MSVNLRVGDKIRPRGGINYGTLGFFCVDESKNVFLATCDHVIKTLSTPDNGPWKVYFPVGSTYSGKIALYEGKSLVSKSQKTADFALAKVLLDIESKTLLPMVAPSTQVGEFTNTKPPREGDEVFLWGARTGTYQSGVVTEPNSNHSWPHGKYGLVKYEKQFSIAISTTYSPEIGDSGGYVITPDGTLVGIIAALSGTISDDGKIMIHCVPVKECCELLGVQPITNQNMEV
jgi:hypothetical protein